MMRLFCGSRHDAPLITGWIPNCRQPSNYMRGGGGFLEKAGSKLPEIANALCSCLSLSRELRRQSFGHSDGQSQMAKAQFGNAPTKCG